MTSSLSLFESTFFRATDPKQQQQQHENMGPSRAEFSLYQPGIETITILRSQFEGLLRAAQQLENLKNCLLKGGVTPESLDVLINEPLLPTSGPTASTRFQGSQTRDNESQFPRKNGTRYNGSDEPRITDEYHGFCFVDKEEIHSAEREDTQQDPATDELRTVDIRGIPDRTTHLDLINAICGGAILELHLKSFDRSARLSFIEPSAAKVFVNNAKQQGFYIVGKKVEVTWAERQFFLRPFIKQNIDHGASRNLVIRNVNPNITDTLIREHLDHIHNLVVVDIKFNEGSAFISTNSVHNAMFARSCMMSRFAYKRMKLEFSPDECTRPFPDVEHYRQPNKTLEVPKLAARKPTTKSLSNRFELLNVEASEESDDSGTTTSVRTSPLKVGKAGSLRRRDTTL